LRKYHRSRKVLARPIPGARSQSFAWLLTAEGGWGHTFSTDGWGRRSFQATTPRAAVVRDSLGRVTRTQPSDCPSTDRAVHPLCHRRLPDIAVGYEPRASNGRPVARCRYSTSNGAANGIQPASELLGHCERGPTGPWLAGHNGAPTTSLSSQAVGCSGSLCVSHSLHRRMLRRLTERIPVNCHALQRTYHRSIRDRIPNRLEARPCATIRGRRLRTILDGRRLALSIFAPGWSGGTGSGSPQPAVVRRTGRG